MLQPGVCSPLFAAIVLISFSGFGHGSEDCPAEGDDIDREEAPDQEAHVLAAAEALQTFLRGDVDGARSWKQIPRVEFTGDNETEAFDEVVQLLTANRPVVLTGVSLTSRSVEEEKNVIWQSIRRILARWRDESPEKRFKNYWNGRGLGRCEEQNFDSGSWEWPWPKKMQFWLRSCGAFGSFGGEDAVRNLTATLEATGGPGAPVHFDSECAHAFSVQVVGSKLYWIQGPDPEEEAWSVNRFVKNFYARNKLKQISAPSDTRMVDYATVLLPGEILLYNLWMPHNGFPVRGHAWSFNGNFRVLRNSSAASSSQPSHLRQLCDMKNEVPGFSTDAYPQVQPWDDEWDAMTSEIRHSSGRGRDWENVVARWTHIWRNRVCRHGGQQEDELGGYRDARCAQLPKDMREAAQ